MNKFKSTFTSEWEFAPRLEEMDEWDKEIRELFDLTEFLVPKFDEEHRYIYYLYDRRDRLLYIGKTENLLMRLGSHLKRNIIPFFKCKYQLIPKEEIDFYETKEIMENRPPYNKEIVSKSNYLDFKRASRIWPRFKGHWDVARIVARNLGFEPLLGSVFHLDQWKKIYREMEKGGAL